MPTIKLKSIPKYAEEGQPNPLNWYILKKIGPDSFENVSAPIICKDFFNDLAFTLQTGDKFSIYGFNAGSFNLPRDESVYMLLTKTEKEFINNINVLNKWLSAQKSVPNIKYEVVKEGILVEFQPWWWKNVYRISLISLIIRLMNIKHEFNSFEEAIQYKLYPPKDQLKWNVVVKKGVYFDVPAKLDKYLWYCGPEYNSETLKEGYQVSSFVHNNGVLQWSNYL